MTCLFAGDHVGIVYHCCRLLRCVRHGRGDVIPLLSYVYIVLVPHVTHLKVILISRRHTPFFVCSARQRSERRHAREAVLHEQEPAEDTEQEEPERSRRQEGRINSTDGATAIGCRGEAIDMAQEGRGGREEGHYRHSGIGV